MPTLPGRPWDMLHGRDPSLALLLPGGPLHLACMLGGLSCQLGCHPLPPWMFLVGLRGCPLRDPTPLNHTPTPRLPLVTLGVAFPPLIPCPCGPLATFLLPPPDDKVLAA